MTILKRVKLFKDTALPSGNAVTALNLMRLGDFTLDSNFTERAIQVIGYQGLLMLSRPSSFSQLLIATDYLLDRSKEIVLVGTPENIEARNLLRGLSQAFLPNKVLAWRKNQKQKNPVFPPLLFRKRMLRNRATVYVCENNICQLPTHDLKKVLQLAGDHRPYSFQIRASKVIRQEWVNARVRLSFRLQHKKLGLITRTRSTGETGNNI